MKAALFCLLLLPRVAWSQIQLPPPKRIIVFMLDDVGFDAIAQIKTPNIDALAASGASFTRAYSHAWCKPSRDSLLRGSWSGADHGEICLPASSKSLSANQPNFVSALQTAGYLTGLIGKWHIGRGQSAGLPWWFAPHAAGYDHWWAGVGSSAIGACYPNGVNNFDDGVFSPLTSSRTEHQRDRLFDLIDEADSQNKKLFAMVGFTDAHSPWGRPSRKILPPGYRIPLQATQRELFEAEVVSLDFVIGQVVARLGGNDWVIVASENGTPKEVIEPQGTRAKSTVYEGGVHVPLIFSGGSVEPRIIDDPVQLYDLGATLLAALEIKGPHGNGRNILAPPPPDVFAFVQNPSARRQARAVIEKRFKLIETLGGLEFYDLVLDPLEQNPLPQTGLDFERLQALLGRLPGH